MGTKKNAAVYFAELQSNEALLSPLIPLRHSPGSGCSILLPTANARVLPWQQADRQWCCTTGLRYTFLKADADQSQNGCAP